MTIHVTMYVTDIGFPIPAENVWNHCDTHFRNSAVLHRIPNSPLPEHCASLCICCNQSTSLRLCLPTYLNWNTCLYSEWLRSGVFPTRSWINNVSSVVQVCSATPRHSPSKSYHGPEKATTFLSITVLWAKHQTQYLSVIKGPLNANHPTFRLSVRTLVRVENCLFIITFRWFWNPD
jgi:hypothetical protein